MGRKKAKYSCTTDILQYFGTDLSLYIMTFIHDPADLIRASSVSHFWQRFVIEHGIAKELCLKTFTGCSNIYSTFNSNKHKNWSNTLKMDHEVYAALLYAFKNSDLYFLSGSGIRKELSASSTYYKNSIFVNDFWSSSGQSNAHAPETLTYKLKSGIWAINEFCVRPCPAKGSSKVNSAKSVRFRIGHSKFPRKSSKLRGENEIEPIADYEIKWSYTSPEFPMMQEDRLQSFKLSKPVLCFDGYLKIELLGRVQRHQKDGLFYICVSDVEALGHCLNPAFDTKMHKRNRKPLLIYNPDELKLVLKSK